MQTNIETHEIKKKKGEEKIYRAHYNYDTEGQIVKTTDNELSPRNSDEVIKK